MTPDQLRSLPEWGQGPMMEFLKLLEEMKQLRHAIDKLRRAITDEIE